MTDGIYQMSQANDLKIIMISSTKEKNIATSTDTDAPPIFKQWSGWYSLVLSFLVIELILFYIIATAF